MALEQFPKVIHRAVETSSAQPLCVYLYELTKEFSRMYQHCSILNAESPALKDARLALATAAGMAIKRGLELLGIDVLERM
jgi:arginyl-tRNA synthetase